MPTEMFMHFFKSFSDAARCNLNITAEGTNEHHKIEAIFKALARAIKMAIRRDVFDSRITIPPKEYYKYDKTKQKFRDFADALSRCRKALLLRLQNLSMTITGIL